MKKPDLLSLNLSLLFALASCRSSANATNYIEECLTGIASHPESAEVVHYDYAKQTTDARIGTVSVYFKSEDEPEKHFGGCLFHDGKLVSLGFLSNGKEKGLIFDAIKKEKLYDQLANSSNNSEADIYRKTGSSWRKKSETPKK